MRKKDKIVLWPLYFDSGRRRGEGRRVPRNVAIPSPTLNEIAEAVDLLGHQYEVIHDASHPRFPMQKSGMLIISKVGSKSQIIQEVSRNLSVVRKGK